MQNKSDLCRITNHLEASFLKGMAMMVSCKTWKGSWMKPKIWRKTLMKWSRDQQKKTFSARWHQHHWLQAWSRLLPKGRVLNSWKGSKREGSQHISFKTVFSNEFDYKKNKMISGKMLMWKQLALFSCLWEIINRCHWNWVINEIGSSASSLLIIGGLYVLCSCRHDLFN